jgi:hypothetical protein
LIQEAFLLSLAPIGINISGGPESTTTRKAGGLGFTAIGGKRQGHEVPQIVENNAVKPGACQCPYRSMSGMVWIFVRRTEKQANISSQSLRL